MGQYVPVIWVDHESGLVEGTQINKERLDRMQTQYKLTAGSRSTGTAPSDPRDGDWYYDDSAHSFRIYSQGWKTVLWTGSDLATNKPLKWDGSAVVTENVLISDVTGLGDLLSDKADVSALTEKVDKILGKGLSTEDYTEENKTKLAGIEENANFYALPQASSSVRGGITADEKGTSETKQVKIDPSTGRLYYVPTIIEASVPPSPTNDTVPGTKLMRDLLRGKSNADSDGRMSDVIQMRADITWQQATERALERPYMFYRASFAESEAGQPFGTTGRNVAVTFTHTTAGVMSAFCEGIGFKGSAFRTYSGGNWSAWSVLYPLAAGKNMTISDNTIAMNKEVVMPGNGGAAYTQGANIQNTGIYPRLYMLSVRQGSNGTSTVYAGPNSGSTNIALSSANTGYCTITFGVPAGWWWKASKDTATLTGHYYYFDIRLA